MQSVSRPVDRIVATFDDPGLVANAGLIVPATLMARLGLEALVNSTVRLVGRTGGALPGRKVCTLVARILAGALPGLIRIADAWSEEFAPDPIDLDQVVDAKLVVPRDPSDDAVLIGDIGATNGSRHAPSERFFKGWQLRNTGTEAWTNRYLTRQGATTGPGLARSARRCRIRPTEPGKVVEVGVHITAPSQPGTYTLYWEMTDAGGNPCFPSRRDLEVIFTFQVR